MINILLFLSVVFEIHEKADEIFDFIILFAKCVFLLMLFVYIYDLVPKDVQEK